MTGNEPPEDVGARVLAVVVTHNAARFVGACLDSIASSTAAMDAVVVDNGSADGTAAAVRRTHPRVAVVEQPNLGFAAGNNRGVAAGRLARHHYALLVNPDVVLDPECAARLAAFMDACPRCAIACPKMHFPDGRTIWFAGATIDWERGVTAHVGEGEADDGRFDTPGPMERACGAAMMVRLAALDAVGPMPDEYFLYYEETDWSRRFVAAGYELAYVPAATCRHDVSSSTGRDSALTVYYMTRNVLLFMSRHGRAHWTRFRAELRRRSWSSFRVWTRHPGNGNLARAIAVAKAHADFALGRFGRRW